MVLELATVQIKLVL